MVSVMFKTVYLFFALFALPHVLAAPGPAALGVRSLTLRDEAIEAHNAARQRNGTPPLTWTEELAVLAGPHAHACEKTRTAPLENLKYANSITEAIHAWAKDDNTQDYALVVGKSMVEFGCNFANCSGRGRLYVCMYSQGI